MTDPLSVAIPAGRVSLQGLLRLTTAARGLVIFAHGSGSGRLSPRNNHLAEGLRQAGLASLLIDLLTPAEERDRACVFDMGLLASRLIAASDWTKREDATASLPLGYFGASTGAGAALVAAARRQGGVRAIVSRGGRPDLAGAALAHVHAPTLLIVGSLDGHIVELNRSAYERIPCEKKLRIVSGAGHLFEEPGTLDEVIQHAAEWFLTYLPVRQEKEDGGLSASLS
jgi:pimeloyl-ACP methyl ester carboxylesterase